MSREKLALNPFELHSRCGDKPLKFQVICPRLSPKRDCSPKRVKSDRTPVCELNGLLYGITCCSTLATPLLQTSAEKDRTSVRKTKALLRVHGSNSVIEGRREGRKTDSCCCCCMNHVYVYAEGSDNIRCSNLVSALLLIGHKHDTGHEGR